MTKIKTMKTDSTFHQSKIVQDENIYRMPTYFSSYQSFSYFQSVPIKQVDTPLPVSNSKKLFYYDCDIKKRTPMEDFIIRFLIKEGYQITNDFTKADYYLGYGNSTYLSCLTHSYKKAVSFSTMVYPSLTYGIDENKLVSHPLKKELFHQLKKSRINEIDKIQTDILFIHAQNETLHPWLQASFLYSSLKDRRYNDHSKMILLPQLDETFYYDCNYKHFEYILTQIKEFFEDES